MRPVRLARIAAEAESVRLRSRLQRTAVRIGMGVGALVFVFGVLVMLHITLWHVLRLYAALNEAATAGILTGIDLIIAVVFGVLAMRSAPSHVETEALEVRQRAVQSLVSTVAISTALIPALRLGVRMLRGARGERA
jgi:hypothetical protein